MSLTLAALVPILAAAGAPLLKRLAESVGGRTGGAVADVVIDSLAREIGTKPTVDAIAAAYDKDPARTVEAIGRVEVQRLQRGDGERNPLREERQRTVSVADSATTRYSGPKPEDSLRRQSPLFRRNKENPW